jgi:ABC-type branched-subunit amino acid transport system permease subunit
MIVLGLLFFLAAAIVGVALIAQNTDDVTIHAFKWDWNIQLYWMVVAGLAIAAVAILGVVMMVIGSAHRRRLWRAASAHRASAREDARLVMTPTQYAPTQYVGPTESAPGARLENTSPPGAEPQSQSG